MSLRQRMLDGFARTGTDPWLVSDIALALRVSEADANDELLRLVGAGLVTVVRDNPLTVRRVLPNVAALHASVGPALDHLDPQALLDERARGEA